MSIFNRLNGRTTAILLLGALLTVLSGSLTAAPTIDPDAAARLRASMAYLGGLKAFGLESENSIEAVLVTGEKIQFDSEVSATVLRPNKMYAARAGELVNQEFFYDGSTVTLSDASHGFHASVEAPDTLEGMLDYARESLDIVAPAGDFIYSNAYEILMQDVYSAFLVGPAVIAGVLCDHLAFSAPGTDFQVWVQRGEQPLPRKLVITSRDIVNAPQFTVVIRKWDLAPDVSAERFRFEAPAGSKPISFLDMNQ